MISAPNSAFPRLQELSTDDLVTGILCFNPSLEIIYINPSAESLLGQGASTLKQRTASSLFPEDNEFIQIMAAVLDDHQPKSERQKTLKTAWGTILTVDCHLSVLTQAETVTGIILELFDSQQYSKIQDETRLLREQQSTNLMLKSLAHEIKNPLGGIRGAAQLLEHEAPIQSLQPYIQLIINETDRLATLVNQMLHPQNPIHPRIINIHEPLSRILTLLNSDDNGGLTIKRDYDPSIPEVFTDPDLLFQALLNIAQNAVQAMQGHGTLTLRTRVSHHATLGRKTHRLVACIEVHDDGPGIPENLKDQIFWPLISGKHDGSGLGLAIAQALVTRMGGMIEYESVPHHTLFRILLPIEDAS